MDEAALERAKQRIADAAERRPDPADLHAVLERSKEQVEALAAAAAELEATLPTQVGDAVRDGLRAEVLPVGRHVAEIRGLFTQLIRRLERMEGDLLAERNARVDDLALLVDLISFGWRGADTRLARIEAMLDDALEHRDAQIAAGPSEDGRSEAGTSEAGTSEAGTANGYVEGLPAQSRQAEAIAERAGTDAPKWAA
jgi:hypothetical protein